MISRLVALSPTDREICAGGRFTVRTGRCPIFASTMGSCAAFAVLGAGVSGGGLFGESRRFWISAAAPPVRQRFAAYSRLFSAGVAAAAAEFVRGAKAPQFTRPMPLLHVQMHCCAFCTAPRTPGADEFRRTGEQPVRFVVCALQTAARRPARGKVANRLLRGDHRESPMLPAIGNHRGFSANTARSEVCSPLSWR